jgi:hypothetical protein
VSPSTPLVRFIIPIVGCIAATFNLFLIMADAGHSRRTFLQIQFYFIWFDERAIEAACLNLKKIVNGLGCLWAMVKRYQFSSH